MSALTPERREQIARMVIAHSGGEVTEERVTALADYAAWIVATFPPFSAEQRSRLAVLLRPVPVDDADDEEVAA